MQEIVINRCWGGFGLSQAAIERYLGLKCKRAYYYEVVNDSTFKKYKKVKNYDGKHLVMVMTKDMGEQFLWKDKNDDYFYDKDIPRTDKDLVFVVEKLKEKANGRFSELKIVKIPDGIKWEIQDYDGMESVVEKHKKWD